MRAVVQRVSWVEAKKAGETICRSERGYLVLLGVALGDTEATAEKLADKVSLIRSYKTPNGDLDIHLRNIHGEVLVVADQSVLARCIRGRRPIFNDAVTPERLEDLAKVFTAYFGKLGLRSQFSGVADQLDITAELDGPVTYIIDSRDL